MRADVTLPDGSPDAAFANLAFWLDAEDASAFQMSFAHNVLSWADKSAVGKTAGRKATITTAGSTAVTRLNGGVGQKAQVNFNSRGDLTIAPALTLPNTGYSAFVVAKTLDRVGSDTLFSSAAGTTFFMRQSASSVTFSRGSTSVPSVSADNLLSNRIRFVSMKDGAAGAIYKSNGTNISVTNGNPVGSLPWNFERLGSSAFWGDVSEILFFDKVLTPAEEAKVGLYLSKKYRIPVSYTPPTGEAIASFTGAAAGLTGQSIFISPGGSATLAWDVTAATSAFVDQSVGTITGSSSLIVSPAVTTTYTVTASGAAGVSTRSVTVHVGSAAQQPVISEFMAAPSGSTPRDEDGDESDWIEIYNPNPFLFNFSGYILTNDPSINAWTIPPGTILQPLERRLIWASLKNRVIPTGELHTNFLINRDAGYLALKLPGGAIENSRFDWRAGPRIPSGVSMGIPAGSGANAQLLYHETPGSANQPSILLAGEVDFDKPSQGFTAPVAPAGPFIVSLSTLSTVPGVELRYTTDRSEPLATSTLYNGPITISGSTMLRARLYQPSTAAYGEVSARHYFLLSSSNITATLKAGATTLGAFTSNLPLVVVDSFTGAGADNFIDDVGKPATFSVFDAVAGSSSLARPATLSSRAGINVRGQSSSAFAKVPYRVELWNQENEDKSEPVLGMPADADWALIGPYPDKLLAREQLNYAIAQRLGLTVPRTRLVEVFVNQSGAALSYDSHYRGVYVLVETHKIKNNRVDIAKLRPNDTLAPDISGGYLFKFDSGVTQVQNLIPNWIDLEIVDPDPVDGATPAQKSWLSTHLRESTDALKAGNFLHPTLGFRYNTRFNMNAIAAHFTLCELNRDQDGYIRSAYYHKDRGGLITPGPLWDKNLTFNVGGFRNNRATAGWQYAENGSLHPGDWDRQFARDPDFWQLFTDRWQASRSTFLSDTAFAALVDEIVAPLRTPAGGTSGPALRNFGRYSSILNNPSFSFTTTATVNWEDPDPTKNDQIKDVKTWAAQRSAWIDMQFTASPRVTPAAGPVATGAMVTVADPGAAPPAGTLRSIYYTMDGSDPRAPGGAAATTALVYTAPVELTATTNFAARIRSVRTLGATSTVTWSGIIRNAYLIGTVPASASNIVFSRIHYNPAPRTQAEIDLGFIDGDQFEFLELMNVGATPTDLGNCRFTVGLTGFTFPVLTLLAPGARTIIVKSVAGYNQRHPGHTDFISGSYAPAGLGDGGERLTLVAADGVTIIRDFVYADTPPWPPGADGLGAALVLSNPKATDASHANALNWTLSGGAEGVVDALVTSSYTAWKIANGVTSDIQDADNDGLIPFLEYATGGRPTASDRALLPTVSYASDGSALLRFVRSRLAENVETVVETSDNLSTWLLVQNAELDFTERVVTSERDTIAFRLPTDGGAKKFYRIRYQ